MSKVAVVSLGCPRNLTDSEVMLGSLKKAGFTICRNCEGADTVIINTCAFIQSAREESIEAVLEAVRMKKEKKIKHLVISGCLSQLYKGKLAEGLKEADLIIGTSDLLRLPQLLKKIKMAESRSHVSGKLSYLYDGRSPRMSLTPRHYAYLKISEGCSNSCSYCIISRLRGQFRSRSVESVVKEIESISKGGKLKEINLIGQDTTLFGMDRYGKITLPRLLKHIARLRSGVEWIRILYTHPAHYTDELIAVMRDEEKMCKYLDIPIQHISDRVLSAMNRGTTRKHIAGLIEKIRKSIPGVILRTSVIVGFPGESDADFRELLGFMREQRFEKLGAFIYSKEEGTRAARYKNHVPEDIKKKRLDELMKSQKGISSGICESFIGKTVRVLIDEKDIAGVFIGRTQGDAPEIDGVVYVSGQNLKIGEFYNCLISDSLEYDLIGAKV